MLFLFFSFDNDFGSGNVGDGGHQNKHEPGSAGREVFLF